MNVTLVPPSSSSDWTPAANMAHGRATRALGMKSGQTFINFDAASWAIRFHPDWFSKCLKYGLYCSNRDQHTYRHILLSFLVAILLNINMAAETRCLLLCPLCFSFLVGQPGLSNDYCVLKFNLLVFFSIF